MSAVTMRCHVLLLVMVLLAALLLTGAAASSDSLKMPPSAARLLSAPTFEPAGHVGGGLFAIAPSPNDANLVYLGEGSGFTALNIADSAHPRQVAGLTLDGEEVVGVAIVGDVAYLANEVGLQTVSLANPTDPQLLGNLDIDGARGVAVVGGVAYVAAGSAGLQIVNVANPAAPALLGAYDTPNVACDVQVAGFTAYVADGVSGLQIINVANPAAPVLLGAYDTPGSAQAVWVVGSTAYVADEYSGLRILNVSIPANPTLLGAYDTPGVARDVTAAGGVAYVADSSGGLQIVDVSDPTAPTLLASSYGGWWADNVALAGDYAFVGSPGKGLRVLDVSDPSSPVILGAFERPSLWEDIAFSDTPAALAGSDGSDAYAVGMNEFWTLDLTDPTIPRPLAKQSLSASATHIVASGALAYVAEQNYGLEIINAADPLNPTVIGEYVKPTGAYVHDVFVFGAYAYLPTASGGSAPGTDGWLRILNVSNPLSPTLAGSFDTPGDARRVVAAVHSSMGQTIAYVADGAAGLRLVDVTNPQAPAALGNLAPPASTTTDAVFVSGNYAFVGQNNAAGGWRLQKVDISNPLSPAVAAEAQSATGQISDLTGYGDLLYVGGSFYPISQSDLAILLSKPGVYVVGVDVHVHGNTVIVYLTLSSSGLSVWTTTGSGEPTTTPSTAPSHTATAEPTRTSTPQPSATPTITPTPPPVQAWVDANGVLHIVLQGDADAKVTVKDGNVLVNDQPVGDPPAKAADIKGIDVQGGTGSNTIDLRDVGRADFPILRDVYVNAGDGNDWVYGSQLDDRIEGGIGHDIIEGGQGDDRMWGGPGEDDLNGGPGSDMLYGGGDSDWLEGGDEADLLDGGDGSDTLVGGAGSDVLVGGAGSDELWDVAGNDTVRGDDGNDKYYTRPGSDDVFNDPAGDDTLDFTGAAAGVALDLDLQDTPQVVDDAGNTLQLEGQFENLVGSPFDDVIAVDPLDVPRYLAGGAQTGGDTLLVDAKGGWVAEDNGVIAIEGYALLTVSGYETISGTHPCPDLAPGASWEHTFTVAGDYPYHDSAAPEFRGSVSVGSALSGRAAALITVSITEAGFEPSAVAIAVGDTVRWVNNDVSAHSVAGDVTACVIRLPLAFK